MDIFKAYTDEQLMELVLGKNQQAFEVLYNRYWMMLYLHAFKMLQNEDEAKDVVQEIFSVLWNNADRLIISSSLKSYLYTAVRNRVLKVFSKQGYRDRFADELVHISSKGHYDVEEAVYYRDMLQIIDKEIKNLPEKMRVIFERSRYDGYSHKEIASELDISEHTVKTTIYRALKVLKAKINLFLLLYYLFLIFF